MRKVNKHTEPEYCVNRDRSQARFKDWKDLKTWVKGNYKTLDGYQIVDDKIPEKDHYPPQFILISKDHDVAISKRLYYNSRKRAKDKTTIIFMIRHNSPIIMLCDRYCVVTGELIKEPNLSKGGT